MLLQLYEHQNAPGFKSDAVMAQLCAAALVSEYLSFFERTPEEFFHSKHPAEKFTVACSAAKTMIVQVFEIVFIKTLVVTKNIMAFLVLLGLCSMV